MHYTGLIQYRNWESFWVVAKAAHIRIAYHESSWYELEGGLTHPNGTLLSDSGRAVGGVAGSWWPCCARTPGVLLTNRCWPLNGSSWPSKTDRPSHLTRQYRQAHGHMYELVNRHVKWLQICVHQHSHWRCRKIFRFLHVAGKLGQRAPYSWKCCAHTFSTYFVSSARCSTNVGNVSMWSSGKGCNAL